MRSAIKNFLSVSVIPAIFIMLIILSGSFMYALHSVNSAHFLQFLTGKFTVLYNLFSNNIEIFSVIIILLLAQSAVIFILQKSRLKHKSLEIKLQKSEEQYKNLIDNINEAVLIIDKSGIITFSSNAISRRNKRLTGRITGYHFTTLIHPEDHRTITEKFTECLDKGSKPFIVRTFDDNGNIMYLRTTARKRIDDGIVTGLTVLMVDITDIKNKEKLLIAAREEAEEANSIKYRFLANISHELRTPLNAILGMSELLLETEISESTKGLVSIIKTSGNSLLSSINDILNFSKIDRCALEESAEVFSLNKVIDEASGMFKIDMDMKEIIFYREVDALLPEYYKGDRRSIRQIFVNLISNAVKFTDSGFIRLSVFSVERKSDIIKLVIEVEDSGIGIPDKEKNRIFQNFYQSDSNSGRIYPGTGLGLAITKKIVEMMDGSISVRNSKRRGSIFKVEIEMTISDIGFPGVFISAGDDKQYSISKKILLVEDNMTNQTLTRIFLEKMNFLVETASNGLEALNILQQKNFDAVLMDCQMPVMDGYEASEEIRKLEEHKAIPIIALTAYAFEEDRKKCMISGMNDFITKPVNRTILYNTLRKWI